MSIGSWNTLSETWVDDQVVYAVDLNDIEHDINYLHGLKQTGARVYKDSSTSISASTWTQLSFIASPERYDDTTESQIHTANQLARLTARLNGKFFVFATAEFAANNTGYLRQIRLRATSGGTTRTIAQASFSVDRSASQVEPVAMRIGTAWEFANGDYVTVEVWHDASSAINVQYHASDEYTPEFGMTLVQDDGQ